MNRPAWSAMVTALLGNGVRTIIIEKLDRLARDLMVQEATIADLNKSEIELISVAEPDLMANDPTRKLMRQSMGAVAEYDRTDHAKLRGARLRKRAAEGRCEGRKPFGQHDGEKAAVERMRMLRAEGLAFDKIAERLDSGCLRGLENDGWGGGQPLNSRSRPQPKLAEKACNDSRQT